MRLKIREIAKLSYTAKDLFYFIKVFLKLHNVWCNAELNLFLYPMQNIKSDYCGIFQLFGLRENSKIITHKKFTRGTIQILLNKFFSLNLNENESITKDYVKVNNINFNA